MPPCENLAPAISLAVLGGAALIVGLYLFLKGYSGLSLAQIAPSWPTVEGTVLESTMAGTQSGSNAGYSAHVKYRYAVDGEKMESTMLRFRDISINRLKHVKATLERYPQGASITVYYDPRNPAHSVLEPGDKTGILVHVIAGAIFFLAGSGLLALTYAFVKNGCRTL